MKVGDLVRTKSPFEPEVCLVVGTRKKGRKTGQGISSTVKARKPFPVCSPKENVKAKARNSEKTAVCITPGNGENNRNMARVRSTTKKNSWFTQASFARENAKAKENNTGLTERFITMDSGGTTKNMVMVPSLPKRVSRFFPGISGKERESISELSKYPPPILSGFFSSFFIRFSQVSIPPILCFNISG